MTTKNSKPSTLRHGALAGVAAAALLTGGMAQAAFVGLNPQPETVSPGDTVTVGVLGDIEGSIPIGAYDMDLAFDSNALDFNQVTFTGNLGASVQDTTPGAGTVNVLETSFDDASDLDPIQPDTGVPLFSVEFEALSPGTTLVDATVNDFDSASGDDFPVTNEPSAEITITDNAEVPLPGSLWLLGAGIIGSVVRRRR